MSRGSSVSPSPPRDGLQPFQCLVCQKRFTRHENLKRHSALHAQREKDITFPCFHCSTVFSRRDLRRRHIKRKHPEAPLTEGSATTLASSSSNDLPGRPGTSSTHLVPQNAAMSTSADDFSSLFGGDMMDSFGGSQMSIEELLSGTVSGPSRTSDNGATGSGTNPNQVFPLPSTVFDPSSFGRLQPPIYSPPVPVSLVTNHHTEQGVYLFFANAAHVFPFLHQPTFDSSSVPEPLLMGVLSLGLLYMEDEEHGSRLAKACFHRGRELLETDHLQNKIASGLELHAIQACLLLEMHAVMSTCGFETAYGLRIHTRAIELARIGGLAEPLPAASNASDLDTLWRQFVRVESHKRTFFALYQFDVMWYHILSIPRTISHLEIKLELPCPQDTWTASTSSDWAHRSLTMGKSTDQGPSRYIQAVRTCMSPNHSSCSPKYDAHGGLLIILFMLSSVREQSGWSTMTGRVSFERFEALHSSLKALEGTMDLSPQNGRMSVVCEATWHMSMIELLLWSTPHTNGVVEGSLDAALAAGTHLTVAQPIIISDQVVESLEPHIQFFLSYLDRTPAQTAMSESPWVTIYSFKAALIAWQLIRAGVGDVAGCIGVGDLGTMLRWIKKVFATRSKWGVGRAVLKSLDELEAVSLVI